MTSSSGPKRGDVLVLVGTRKGGFILSSDASRRQWSASEPHFGGGSKPKRTAPARVTRPPRPASQGADAPTTAAPRPAPKSQPSPAPQAPAQPPVAEPQPTSAQASVETSPVADSPTVTHEAAPGPGPVAPPETPAREPDGAQDVASLLGGSVVPQGGTMIMGAVSADAPGAP